MNTPTEHAAAKIASACIRDYGATLAALNYCNRAAQTFAANSEAQSAAEYRAAADIIRRQLDHDDDTTAATGWTADQRARL
jgi:hypothetical protein